jgi:hypothetical protein
VPMSRTNSLPISAECKRADSEPTPAQAAHHQSGVDPTSWEAALLAGTVNA